MNKKLKEPRTLLILGVGNEPARFDDVRNLVKNSREISFTGIYKGMYVEVQKLKPSGLIPLDITGDIKAEVADDLPQDTPLPKTDDLPSQGDIKIKPSVSQSHTQQQLFDLGNKLYNEGKDVVGKGLKPLGYDTFQQVPLDKIDEVFNFMESHLGSM